MSVSNSMEKMVNGFHEIGGMSHKEQSGTHWERCIKLLWNSMFHLLDPYLLQNYGGWMDFRKIFRICWMCQTKKLLDFFIPDWTVSHSSNYAEVCALRVLLVVGCVAFLFSFLLQIISRVLLERVMCITKYCFWALHVTGPIEQRFMGRFIREKYSERRAFDGSPNHVHSDDLQ